MTEVSRVTTTHVDSHGPLDVVSKWRLLVNSISIGEEKKITLLVGFGSYD